MRKLIIGLVTLFTVTSVNAAPVTDWSCTTVSDAEVRIVFDETKGPKFVYSSDDLTKSFTLVEDAKTHVSYNESDVHKYYRFSYMSKELVEMSWVLYTGILPDVGAYQGILIFAGDTQIMEDKCAVQVDVPLLRDIYVKLDEGSTHYDLPETTAN